MEPTETFKTEQQARDYCEHRNANGGEGSWISWELESGEWGVVHTTLPAHLAPSGAITEAKPKPSEPDDPPQGPKIAGYPGL